MGLNHDMISRLHGSVLFEVVAVVIRPCGLKNCLWKIFLGENGERPCRDGPSFFFIMTHVDRVAQNTQTSL